MRRGWRTMVAGYTGEGKSTLIGRMTKAIMTGGEFLGWEGAGNGAKVLFIDLEQDLVIAQRRMVEFWFPGCWDERKTVAEMIEGKPFPPEFADSAYCRWSEGLGLNVSEVDKAVVEEKIALVQPDLVVFDPLYKGFEGNPNEQELAVAVMRILDGWREKYGFGLLLGAHMRKPNRQGATFTKHEVSSSGAWIFGAEVVLGIKRLQGNGAAMHFFKDRAGDLPTNDFWTLEYSVDRGFRRASHDAGKDGSKLPRHEKVWRLLQEVPGKLLTRSDIADMLHMTSKSVRDATETLEARHEDGNCEGLVVESGPNRTKLYGYKPDSEKLTLDKLREMFGAEEDEE